MPQITLELSSIALIIDRFTSYQPRQPINDQRASFNTSTFGASIIESVGFEPKNIWRFGLLTTDLSMVNSLRKLDIEQKLLIDTKAFTGITLTDEMHRFLEKSITPTRQKTADAIVDEGNGYISYWAKFKVGMDLSFGEPNGWASVANIILIEMDKLVP